MSNEKMTGRFNRNTAKETEEQSMAFDRVDPKLIYLKEKIC